METVLKFNSSEDLISYAKNRALRRATIKSKATLSSSGSILILYKESLKEIYKEISRGIKNGTIVVEKEENKLVLKKQK